MEWALLAIIALVCAVLSFLQYRWTGELSRAEPALLRAGLNQQLRGLSQNFNNDIRENCASLVPAPKQISEMGALDALRNQYEQWASSHDRSLFRRIAIAVPEKQIGTAISADRIATAAPAKQDLALYAIDEAGKAARVDWPSGWEMLRAGMLSRLEGTGRRPNPGPASDVIEMPIFGSAGSELGWMIFDLNEDYIRTRLLPRLVNEYLNPAEPGYEVSVSRTAAPGNVIFSTRSDHKGVSDNADATAGLLSLDMGGGGGRGRGRGRFRDGRGARWIIAVRHRYGSLEAAVAAARKKNLVASLILVGLLGGTAWALVQYTARSRRLAEMQFRFAAGISHDLRTPLTAIRGAAFNLVEGVVKEPAAVTRYLRLIVRNAEELTAMIENVLAFSSTLRSGQVDRAESIAIGGVLKHAVEAMTPEIEQAGCRIELNISRDLPAVAADPVAVELVFRNLIGNAARHGVGGNWIGVSAVASGDAVEVHVCDHGPGVLDSERDRIFEPFYRGEQTRAQRLPGSGLGLSLVKNTVERYKGTVEVKNSPGGGAQFTIRLPALRQAT